MRQQNLITQLSQLDVNTKLRVIAFLEREVGIGSGTSTQDSGESVAFDLLRRLQKPQPIIFDVGANVGIYTALAISRLPAGTDYAIHSFEPSKATFDAYISAHQGNPRVFPNNQGLADKEGIATLYMDTVKSGLASLTQRQLDFYQISHGALQETVSLTTIDAYCATKNITEINLLKIDVEGHELDVLRGAQNLLGKGSVDIVTFEFGGCNIDTRTYLRDFFVFFTEHNYGISRILPSGQLWPVKSYHERLEKFSTSNYVAILRKDLNRDFSSLV